MTRERTIPVARAARRNASAVSLDLVCCSAADRQLVVLGRVGDRRKKPELPWMLLAAAEPLSTAAQKFARAELGRAPAWNSQLGAFSDGHRHPSGAPLTVAYLVVVPLGTAAPNGMGWFPVNAKITVGAEIVAHSRLSLGARQQSILEAASAALRDRMDIAPIAFRMLPDAFTLSELQEIYELLLGRRLHKASFRRALQGAFLVEPAGEWRSEGRGRPAQLFRYAPRHRRANRRSVRFELLG